ncbi:hypothetical protein [Nonomuraea salmonea]|uniref:hypothetical protein n=1 Tax=Nonomuraea salmonea TaxID=46181 RepID=UPI002FEA5C09
MSVSDPAPPPDSGDAAVLQAEADRIQAEMEEARPPRTRARPPRSAPRWWRWSSACSARPARTRWASAR